MITFTRIGYFGRLGNQMFQMASTIGIAKRLGFEYSFPLEYYLNSINSPKDSYDGCKLYDCFKLSPDIFKPVSEIVRGVEHIYTEQTFGFDEQTRSLPDGVDLHGYYQTEKYFLEYRELILSLFAFKDTITEAGSNYIETIRNQNRSSRIASIHVRRGDYATLPNHHPVCSKEYYKNSISKIKENEADVKFIIFSDDPDWCRNEFFGENYIISDLGDAYIELCAMSLCDHNIIANSSFSWWGAWLNNNPNKIVISPSKWFGPAIGKDTSDVYCKNWVKL